jgi:hypothetical protein
MIAAAAAALTLSVPLSAETYSVNVTRKDSNLYKVDGKRVWVNTRYCYHYGYSDEAVLTPDRIVFVNAGEKCDVRQVYSETSLSAGTYKVTVTQESGNVYSTYDGVTILTSMCLNLAIGEQAALRMAAYGGKLIFLNSGDSCEVEAVLSPVQL